MYVNPVLAGIIGTLLTEALILIFVSLLVYIDSKGEERDGKDNNNQSNQ